ncbi:hypothetical protein A176_005257 [Myxococcus hansupus]|uniref:Uncharacterized protein n=1 Tax=Pseudomyxococcus hansupus TaxID=1297742 RepID=A0A0H4X3X4_9BACT|nr:hypothetical protein [Myxococcus hansupus]AKQ68345.1 hypothetical protein A176_005257 [Myxococcus hansupus]
MATIPLTINDPPVTVDVNGSAFINQTLSGYMILTVQNLSPSRAQVLYSSGGSTPQPIDIPGGENAPYIVIQDWRADNLTVINVSPQDGTQVKVGIYGLGTPTTELYPGVTTTLDQYQSAGTKTQSQFMALQLAAPGSSQTALFFVFSVGKPVAYALNVNDPSGFPPGYITTPNNQTRIVNNWQGRNLFVINTSTDTGPREVRLDSL